MTPLLEGRGLTTRAADKAVLIDDVTIALHAGERVGLVGPSGAGKTTLLRLLLRLRDPDAGQIFVNGVDVTRQRGRALLPMRRCIQPVFQDPATSLHPRATVGAVVAEGLRIHGLHRGAESARVAALLADVGLAPSLAGRRAVELSGGQRQRVALARALAVEPRALLLDEPLSALDATVAAQILNLCASLSSERGVALLLVSHDPGVVQHLCERVIVLSHGRIVEEGPVHQRAADRAGAEVRPPTHGVAVDPVDAASFPPASARR